MNLSNLGRGLRSTFVLLLCGLFFLLAIGITLLGSGVYSDAVNDADQNYTRRTTLSYLVNQIRRSDTENGVWVGTFGDGDALVLREGEYITILYCYGGQLRELFTEEGTGLTPSDGVEVLPLESLSIEVSNGSISIAAMDLESRSYHANVSPRCGVHVMGEVIA